jgi:hypothetical protein
MNIEMERDCRRNVNYIANELILTARLQIFCRHKYLIHD